MKSGIYIRVGKENKDLIFECTTTEFLQWLKEKSEAAYSEAIQVQKELGYSLPFRMGYLLGLAPRYGIAIVKIQTEFEACMQQLGTWDRDLVRGALS